MKISSESLAKITGAMAQQQALQSAIQQYVEGLADGLGVDLKKFGLDAKTGEFTPLNADTDTDEAVDTDEDVDETTGIHLVE